MFRRLSMVMLTVSLFLMILIGRLAYIQIFGTESFSKHQVNLIKKSVQQRQQQVVLHSGRGEITDRYGQSLTSKMTHVLVSFPFLQLAEDDRSKWGELSTIIGIPYRQLQQRISQMNAPGVLMFDHEIVQLTEYEAQKVNELEMSGVLGLPYELRYDKDKRVAQHLIGLIGQNPEYIRRKHSEEMAQGRLTENSEIGISGLEKTFQPFLQGLGPTTLSYYVDAKGAPMFGMDIKYAAQDNPFHPLVVQTTLDLQLQEQVERVLNETQVEDGTVVILDADTSEVLAMSSRPNYMHQLDYIEAWENKALKRYTPGSIYKIVVAAAALEEELLKPHETFQCDGELEGTHFHCWKKEGHGKITFEEAFAQSCNIAFGQLTHRLGHETLEEYTYRLGLLQENGWTAAQVYDLSPFAQFDREEIGQVFSSSRTKEEKEDDQYLLRTGIGQLDVQLTPLAVANMLASITKGGHKHEVKVVRDILYQTGGNFYHFQKHSLEGASISPYTAYRLQKLLAEVVQRGTAETLNEYDWDAAGKTGTAQITKEIDHEEQEFNHQWFAGYYPQHQPRYVIVALTLNQSPNQPNRSLQVFAQIADWLNKNR